MNAQMLAFAGRRDADSRVAALEAENAKLRERLAFFEREVFGDVLQFPADWGLTRLERRMLGILVSVNVASEDALLSAMYRGAIDDEPKLAIVHVKMVRLRRKLRPRGIVIRTLHGVGFAINQPRRGELRRALRLTQPPWRRPAELRIAEVSEP